MVPEVALVHVEGRLTIQPVQHVPRALVDMTLGAEGIPAAHRPEAHLHGLAVDADRHQTPGREIVSQAHEGL